jgi:Spx/MgsR family transcriptional regulator
MYGIPNCDTIKKARKWLDEHDVAYVFHNYKKEGVDAVLLQQWSAQVGWESLLNKRGTTWRKLADSEKEDIDETKALALLVANPSMIKRPVLQIDKHIEVGFSEASYMALFA